MQKKLSRQKAIPTLLMVSVILCAILGFLGCSDSNTTSAIDQTVMPAEEKLSLLDNEKDKIKITRVKVLLGSLAKMYNVPVDTIAEYTSKAQGVLEDYGIKESNLNILEEMNQTDVSKLDGIKYSDVITLYLMTKTGDIKQ